MTAITKTTDGLNLLRDSESGAQSDKITYFAIGSSNTAPTAGDHTLGNEVFRKKIASYAQGANGEILVSGYLSDSDAVGANIQEVAFFSGNASGTPNSGVMVGRGLYVHNPKQSNESITFTLDVTFN